MQLIHKIFGWIYIRPISQLLLLIILVSAIFLRIRKMWETRPLWKWALVLGLISWGIAVVFSTVSDRETAAVIHSLSPFHSYRELLGGGNPEILRSNFMNLVLFYPAGLFFVSLLPRKFPVWFRLLLALALFGFFSVGIEYVQFTESLGNAEADDVIHNTLGALLGGVIALYPSKNKRPG